MTTKVSVLADHMPTRQTTQLQQIFENQRRAFHAHPMPDAAERIEHIQRLRPALLKHMDRLIAAVSQDFGNRCASETKFAEMLTTMEAIKYHARNVRKWMRTEKRSAGLLLAPAKVRVVYQPVGVVGIIVPWNYPLFLALGPLLSALSAGNRAMIKMSEYTPATADAFKTMIQEIYPEDHVAVITGEADVGVAFSKLPFDHLLFTGSTAVGKHVMRAAADNLTPVTLELGGKSPAIIHESFPMQEAAERIAFGKCLNAGQTCVAPDYVMVPRQRVDEFVTSFSQVASTWYPTIRDNNDFTSIVNDRQFNRLQGYLQNAKEKGAKIIPINPKSEDLTGTRKIPFTLVLDSTPEMQIEQDEIFGPLLIVKPYDTLEDAIAYINERPRPLALYYFDFNAERSRHVTEHTHSGGMCINDTLSHVAADDLPFGGAGASGMGHYHGREGFLTFSKAKGVVEKGKFNATRFMFPPWDRRIHKLLFGFFLK
ncbi:putative coniferyl aldehyde dehydrogenase [gamma proteobacterium HdN1]|nr:putative coniferyl aldehyde dehydrogenase [gamma proteobacterium HdN1]